MDMSNISYYHGGIERTVAHELLTGKADGSFLLRKSLNKPNAYAISVAYQGYVLNYSIQLSPSTRLYCIDQGMGFETPVKLCEHYSKEKHGLKIKLMYPLPAGRSPLAMSRAPLPTPSPPVSPNLDSYESYEWFHGNISREDDAYRLSCDYRKVKQDGIYLVREKEGNFFALSLVYRAKVHRYKIAYNPGSNTYCVCGKEQTFTSLVALVDYYKQFRPGGLLCKLQYACSRNSAPPVYNPPRAPRKQTIVRSLAKQLEKIMPKNSLTVNWDDLKEDSLTCPSSPHPTDLSKLAFMSRFNRTSLPKDSVGFQSPYRNLASDKNGTAIAPDLYITNDKINIGEEVGRGHFGSVRIGECKIRGSLTPCAVKTLSGGDVHANKNELLHEASVMQKLDHPYIVRVLAVCDSSSLNNELKIVLELAPLGDLRAFLRQHNQSTFPEERLLALLTQVCDGMAYLSSQNVVHRDLAARNVLMVSEYFVKISDFGMSRILHDSESYYKAAKPGSWPLRWYAPEALLFYKFTSKGDVWSYGITLWEAFSYGSRPYQSMKGQDILNMLEAGNRLECPCGCSPSAYRLMLHCWAHDPEKRPSFSDLLLKLQNLLDE